MTNSTQERLRTLFAEPLLEVPPRERRFGSTTVRWWEGKPGEAVIMAEGGTCDDRTIAEQVIAAQLEAVGYKRAQFHFDSRHRTSKWVDIMAKAKRLIQSGNVTVLRNGFNNIVGHVIGDHGEYNTEIGRDDPNGRAITTWTCECPWDQYAWQRTRQWKKYEGRPCAHVLALYWKSLGTPLDDYDPQAHGPYDPGQKQGPPPPPSAPPDGGGGGIGPAPPFEPSAPSPDDVPGPAPVPTGMQPMAPPSPPGVLPPSPADQLAQMQPPIPGATPAGQPANPAVVSVPGAKMQSPFNPIQFPGGTYSKKIAADVEPPQIIRLKEGVYGTAVGKSEAHGAGSYRLVPEGSTGEVIAQDETTGWIEAIFPIDDAGPMEPYHVQCFLEPSQIERTRIRPPGPFIKRRH